MCLDQTAHPQRRRFPDPYPDPERRTGVFRKTATGRPAHTALTSESGEGGIVDATTILCTHSSLLAQPPALFWRQQRKRRRKTTSLTRVVEVRLDTAARDRRVGNHASEIRNKYVDKRLGMSSLSKNLPNQTSARLLVSFGGVFNPNMRSALKLPTRVLLGLRQRFSLLFHFTRARDAPTGKICMLVIHNQTL
jgi:hypothetical protein